MSVCINVVVEWNLVFVESVDANKMKWKDITYGLCHVELCSDKFSSLTPPNNLKLTVLEQPGKKKIITQFVVNLYSLWIAGEALKDKR